MRRTIAIVIAILLNMLAVGMTWAAVTSAYDKAITGELVSISPEQTITPDTSKKTGTAAATADSAKAAAVNKVPANVVINSGGQLYQFNVLPQAELLIDGLSVKLTDFRAGLEVTAYTKGQLITKLESHSNDQPGYLNPALKNAIGTIIGFDTTLEEVRLRIGNEELSLPITPDITILENGTNISPAQLSVGDKFKIVYDENGDITLMERQGRSILVKDLIKGRLRDTDTISGKINLENIKVLRNGQWTDYSSFMQLPCDDKVPIYYGSTLLSARNLKYYAGKDFYAALGTSMGKDCIKKMVLKTNYERIYSSTIYEFTWDRDSVNLTNSANIGLNDGTIIVQNGRLVGSEALDERCQATVVAGNASGRLVASVISIMNQGLNDSPLGEYHLLAGHILQLTSNDLKLAGVYNLDQNKWRSGGQDELSYSEDTIIYDINRQKVITRNEFFNGDYSSYYGYFYTDEDNIIAMALQKTLLAPIDNDNTTYGVISGTTNGDALGWSMTLTDVHDWNSSDSAWRARNSNAEINLKTALILKRNETINASALAAGDRVFVVRTGYRARMVFVK